LQVVEIVVALADPQHRNQMLALAVPIFVKMLLEPAELAFASKWIRALHDHALQRLMIIGPQYPQEFCTVMSYVPQLRFKLEMSIRAKQSDGNKDTEANSSSMPHNNQPSSATSNSHTPSIKLKTDFSNFTG